MAAYPVSDSNGLVLGPASVEDRSVYVPVGFTKQEVLVLGGRRC